MTAVGVHVGRSRVSGEDAWTTAGRTRQPERGTVPTYEYYCPRCKKKFDHLQSFSEQPLRKCLLCKKAKPQRLISSGAGLIFKGSGFYSTDYKKQKTEEKGQKTEVRAQKTEAATPPPKSEKLADKPAAKAEKKNSKD